MGNRMRRRVPWLVVALAWAVGPGRPAAGQLRILDYNVGGSSSASPGPRPGMDAVLAAINAQTRAGFARAIDILLMQEGDSTSTTGQAYATLLNTLSGGTTYLRSTVNGTTTGAGRPMAVYNSATVTLVAEEAIGVAGSAGQPRQTLRYQFRPVGYDASADFYVYNSHFKAVDDAASANRRNIEAQANRANADALGPNVNVIYTGDLNLYTAAEAAFQTLTAPGNGQAFDPVDAIGDWSDNAAFRAVHTQSPATTAAYPGQVTGGMDDRFDFQLVSGEWLDGRGLDYIAGSYWAFGNTGSQSLNGAITTGSPSALQAFLPGYSVAQSGTILTFLSQVSDHLPVVADYQIPARLSASLAALPATVIRGAVVTGTLAVSNSAPVGVSQGADRLDYGYQASGLLAGSGTGSDLALGPAQSHLLAVSTTAAGLRTGTASVVATSPQTATPGFSQPVTMSVLDHAIGSFAAAGTVTTLDVNFGTLTQGTGTASQAFGIFNRPGTLGAAWTAKLDLDGVTGTAPGVFATTLAPFANLASGSSRTYGMSMLTTTTGSFVGTYALNLSDEDLPGATAQALSLTVRGSVVSPATVLFDVASGTQTQVNLGFAAITGTAAVTKTGGGAAVLDQANTFTGATGIQQGTIALTSTSALAGSALVALAAGSALDVRGLAGGYAVPDGQTVGGSGTVWGSVTFGRNSRLAPGTVAAGGGLGWGGLADGGPTAPDPLVSVPEPSTLVLLAGGAASAAGWGRRRTRRRARPRG